MNQVQYPPSQEMSQNHDQIIRLQYRPRRQGQRQGQTRNTYMIAQKKTEGPGLSLNAAQEGGRSQVRLLRTIKAH